MLIFIFCYLSHTHTTEISQRDKTCNIIQIESVNSCKAKEKKTYLIIYIFERDEVGDNLQFLFSKLQSIAHGSIGCVSFFFMMNNKT